MPPALLRLPYDATLTRAGIEYAKRSLHYTYNRMRLGAGARLRKIVAGVAVELAFQRWLDTQGARYERLGATPFTAPDRYDLRLGGRRCDLKSFLVSDKAQISALRRDPTLLYAAEALVPEDQFHSDRLDEADVYVFGFLAGLETRGADALDRALRAEQPVYLLHVLERPEWRGGEAAWRSLGRLILKSDGPRPLRLEVGGQDAARAARAERLMLAPRARTVTAAEYYTLLYLHAAELPAGQIGVRSAALRQTQLIAPKDWVNIWVYGLEVFIAGWLTKAEFRERSRRLPRGAAVWQYPKTQTDNRAVAVAQLRPIGELAALVKRGAA
ncbi:MAG: hypothetical protein IT317_03470 [Anaerolineales bacterium]|nr:hypothetical protein [Anaerolineales bacterium]